MAYGTPRNLGEVGAYYSSIRGGRAPTPEAIKGLTERYRTVGGRTPLLDITKSVASALEQRLNQGEQPIYSAYVGMKHWHPFIAETVQQIAADGVQRLMAIPLAPHYSRMSIDGYREALQEAIRSVGHTIRTDFIESWHGSPLYISILVQRVEDALKRFGQTSTGVEVIFSAHSLPRRILSWDDPYPRELHQSCEAVARAANLSSWRFSYQSAGHTADPWLGPDILETISMLAGQGTNHVLLVPIGFVCDHLEILFDIDVEAQKLANGLGLELKRIDMPNASPDFIETLADLVLNGTGARVSELH